MCLPAAAAPALLPYILGLSAASTVVSTIGAYQQAQGQKNMNEYQAAVSRNNAQVAEWQAQDALKRGDEAANAARRQADQQKGMLRVGQAARGLDLNEGTAADLQDQIDFFSVADQARARDNGKKEAWAKRAQGQNATNDAAMYSATADSINPLFAAGTTLLSSAGSVAEKWYAYSKGK